MPGIWSKELKKKGLDVLVLMEMLIELFISKINIFFKKLYFFSLPTSDPKNIILLDGDREISLFATFFQKIL